VGQLGEQVAEVGVDLEGERVQPLRAVEGDGDDAAVLPVAEVPPALGEARRGAKGANGVQPPFQVCPRSLR
jgi:hypothetical protein